MFIRYRQLRIAAQDKENDSRKQLDKIKALREDMKVIAKGAKDKERLYASRTPAFVDLFGLWLVLCPSPHPRLD